MRWIGRLLLFFVVLLAILAVLPFVVPLGVFFTDNVQSAFQARLQRPVRVSNITFRYSPYPTLVVEGLRVGTSGQDAEVPEVLLVYDWRALLSGGHNMRNFVLSKGTYDWQFVRDLPALLQKTASTAPITKLEFVSSQLKAPNHQYGPINADLILSPKGDVKQLELFTDDKKLRATLTPQQGGYQVTMNVTGWTAPGQLPVEISSLELTGVATNGDLTFSQVSGVIYSGRVTGALIVDWHTPTWVVTSNLAISGANAESLTTALNPVTNFSGRMNANVHYSASADTIEGLWDASKASVSFNSSQGQLRNFDFVTPIRRISAGKAFRGGSTKFESLEGEMAIDARTIHVSRLALRSGLLNVGAHFTVGSPQAKPKDQEGDKEGERKIYGGGSVVLGPAPNRVTAPITIAGTFKFPSVLAGTLSETQAEAESASAVVIRAK